VPTWTVEYLPAITKLRDDEFEAERQETERTGRPFSIRRRLAHEEVAAHRLRVEGGSLVFVDAEDVPQVVYGPHAYLRVYLIHSD
jgi:hypothetical protein